MKNLHIALEDKEYKALNKVKEEKGLTWHDPIMSFVDKS